MNLTFVLYYVMGVMWLLHGKNVATSELAKGVHRRMNRDRPFIRGYAIEDALDEEDEADYFDLNKRQQFDDYGHMRFGKRKRFNDYGHMRFGRSHE